jgi:hypothetical protein
LLGLIHVFLQRAARRVAPQRTAKSGQRPLESEDRRRTERPAGQAGQPSSVQQPDDRSQTARLEAIPNVGPAIATDLRRLGITSPGELLGRDPYAMYDDLCRITGQRHDPCLLDTFIAAVRFMAGEPKRAWWKYMAERKRELAARNAGSRESYLPPRLAASRE